MRLLLLIFGIVWSCGVVAQEAPKVFIIDEESDLFERLSNEDQYKTLLLEVCDNDMNLAYSKWRMMMKEMEGYAGRLNYDIRGVKIWLKVLWNKRGGIDHIAYSLKPTSRNIDTEIFTIFLNRFIQGYAKRIRLRYTVGFSHYTNVAFPIK